MMIKLNKAAINAVDITSCQEFLQWNPAYKDFLTKGAGEEHYKLLNFLAKKVAEGKNGILVSDIGTLYGSSAIAFATAHPSVQVTTYDIANLIPTINGVKTINQVSNIRRKFMSGQLDVANIAKSDLVLLDIDPHEGVEERKFVQLLKDHGFKGLLVVDDIHLNQEMIDFWESVSLRKVDITELGHWTGTGIIVYDPDTLDIQV
jgi:predicted O-methyltransferase YrrM